MAARVVVAVGTKKGLFVLEGSTAAKRLELRGPFFAGQGVNAILIDRRGRTPRIVAGPSSAWFGTTIQISKDLGKKFKPTQSAPAFAADDGRTLKNIWSLAPGGDGADYLCGIEPAALFRSGDGGDSWEKVPGITDHAHARQWHPGNGGLCMHTILHHDGALHLGISTGGHYASRDGQESFAPENAGVGAGFMPDRFPEFGQCVHKIAAHADRPERLYMQNHGGFPEDNTLGVLRSDDGGRNWQSIVLGALAQVERNSFRFLVRGRRGGNLHRQRQEAADSLGRLARDIGVGQVEQVEPLSFGGQQSNPPAEPAAVFVGGDDER